MNRAPDPAPLSDRVAWGENGLVPAVVQDRADGSVLMVAFMDAVALAATLETGDVHFHSRSRGRLWRKGETSGNVLRLVGIDIDCDGDALLVTVDPHGPTCHRGTRSCFDSAEPPSESRGRARPRQGFGWLETLWATIDARASADPAVSYTARLLGRGVDGTARKVAEEATEVVMAAKDDAAAERSGAAADERESLRAALSGEVADLLYHTFVLLRERSLDPIEVIRVLQERHKP